MVKNIIFLSWQILKQTRTMEILRETVWSWVVQQVTEQPLFKKWLLTLSLEDSRVRTGCQSSSFPKPERERPRYILVSNWRFSFTQDEYDLRKTFVDFYLYRENLYREKLENKKNIIENSGNGKGEYVERDNVIALDDVTGLAGTYHSFVKFLTMCGKYGYSVLYIFHEPALSSPWSMERYFISDANVLHFFISYEPSSKSPHEIYSEES